jgi:phospholipid/cholesterol/gamma-HCH transport system ATP-binding protein
VVLNGSKLNGQTSQTRATDRGSRITEVIRQANRSGRNQLPACGRPGDLHPGTERRGQEHSVEAADWPDAGSIRLEGHDISSVSPKELNEARRRVGFLFQQSALYDSMTIEENVAFPLRRNTKLSNAERLSRVHELLESVGMDRDLDKMPSDISGGMSKRVGLARALALEPTIVMFDEPTAGLDPISAAEIAKLIVELRDQRHITSIVVTHDLHTARTIADRLIVIDGGKTLFDGTFEDLNRSKDPFIAQFVKDAA